MEAREVRRQQLKEGRAAQGEDFRLHVAPRLTPYIEMQKQGLAWVRLAAAMLFIGNGATLLLLPVLAGAARASPARNVEAASTWLALGLVFAAILTFAAWLNTLFRERDLRGAIGQQLYISEAIHYDREWPLRYVEDPRGRNDKMRPEIVITFFISALAGVASAICFIVGAIRLS